METISQSLAERSLGGNTSNWLVCSTFPLKLLEGRDREARPITMPDFQSAACEASYRLGAS
jgi:hypothetical protein